jgi:hypothetical protein
MKFSEYKKVYDRLRIPRDIKDLAKNGYNSELLLVIYNQKVVRESTRRFYQIKDKSKKLLRDWKRGASFVEIARKVRFPSVLVAHLILKENQLTKKKFWKYLSNPKEVRDKRLRNELTRVAKDDIVYSPVAMEDNYKRGKLGEEKINKWLTSRKISFRTEDDIKGEYPKTPDFLLKKPIKFMGSKRYWIESKASFGSPDEMKRNIRKQLKHYKELFGDGIVIYWFGFVEDYDINMPEGVFLGDDTFFKQYDRNA